VYYPILRITNLDLNFFGLNLAIKPASFQHNGWWLLSIPVITALLQWYQSKLMIQGSMAASSTVAQPVKPINKKFKRTCKARRKRNRKNRNGNAKTDGNSLPL